MNASTDRLIQTGFKMYYFSFHSVSSMHIWPPGEHRGDGGTQENCVTITNTVSQTFHCSFALLPFSWMGDPHNHHLNRWRWSPDCTAGMSPPPRGLPPSP